MLVVPAIVLVITLRKEAEDVRTTAGAHFIPQARNEQDPLIAKPRNTAHVQNRYSTEEDRVC